MAEAKKETKVEKIEEEVDLWEQKRTVVVVRRYPGEKQRDIMLNGRFFTVKTNVPVELPLPIANVIELSNGQMEMYDELNEKLQNESQELKA